jgi:hypothetical protein
MEEEDCSMKLYDVDIKKLIELLDKAKGNVYLVTDDGNKLNLKSKLCQIYGVRQLLEMAKNSTVTAELSVENPEDELMFINYMMRK